MKVVLKLKHCLEAVKLYRNDLKQYKQLSLKQGDGLFLYDNKIKMPMLMDRFRAAGNVDEHYFFQDMYMAREIFLANPENHYDIGSKLDGFIAHLLSFRESVTMIDIRPLPYDIRGLKFMQGNAMELDRICEDSLESLSSLHAIEHFGLGRYGDPVNPQAWKIALQAMEKSVKKDGRLYISVPIGPENRVYFNAHRIFEIHLIPQSLEQCKLIKFAYIKEGRIVEVPVNEFDDYRIKDNYLCGMYIFEKSDK
ncbi:DUF268 domain-containing protein [Lachnospiraceae bacterium 54-11]